MTMIQQETPIPSKTKKTKKSKKTNKPILKTKHQHLKLLQH